MLEHIYALSMVFMEMLFLFTVLLALYHQRKVIGDSAFLMIMALLFTFDRWIAAADIRVLLWGGESFQVGEVAISLPALSAFLLVYIMQGVLAAQRVFLGMISAFLIVEFLLIFCNIRKDGRNRLDQDFHLLLRSHRDSVVIVNRRRIKMAN